MKKFIAVLVIFICVGTALSAQSPFSFGLGGNFGAHFSNFKFSDLGKTLLSLAQIDTKEFGINNIGSGLYAFFDMKFLEANIGLMFGRMKLKIPAVLGVESEKITYTNLTLGLFGKFPIDLGTVAFFPMLGIEGYLNMGAKYGGEKWDEDEIGSSKADMFNQFWIKFGIGGDFNLTYAVFVRANFLYGFRFNTKEEKDMIKELNKLASYEILKSIIGHGLDIKIALGFRL